MFIINRIWPFVFIFCFCISCNDTEATYRVSLVDRSKRVTIATMGASLMYSENGWVEQACTNLGYRCFNKAISNETSLQFAQKLWKNEYLTRQELSETNILLIQFANCLDVYGDSSQFYTTADEYTKDYTNDTSNPFSEYTHAQRMDYILKKWNQLCIQYNKPRHIIFVTHWHDGRVIYNESIRKLAQRWNAGICELDKNIGFTKDKPLPDGTQQSIQYAVDTEFIDGIEYGWHPLRGEKGKNIQGRMAAILEECLRNYVKQHPIE